MSNIKTEQRLSGTIKNIGSLSGSNKNVGSVSGTVAIGEGVRPDYYDGSYEIIPIVEDQTLEVKNKTMRDDVEIKAIPYAEVTNEANGITVTIGG